MKRQTQELYVGLLTNFYFQVTNNDVDHLIYEEMLQHQSEMNAFSCKTPEVIRDNVVLKVYKDEQFPQGIQPNCFYAVAHHGDIVSISLHVKLTQLYLIIRQLSIVDINWSIDAILINLDKLPTGFNITKKFRLGRHYNRFVVLGYDDCKVRLVLRQINNLPVEYIDLRNNPLFYGAIVKRVIERDRSVMARHF